MISKKIVAAFAIALISINLIASEDVQTEDKCEYNYSKCLAACDSSEGDNAETCYDKCDESYSNCLEEIQTK